MYFQRVTRRDDPGFIRAMALYAKSFPLHEQRLSDSQLAILGEEAYHLDQIIQDGRFLGAIFYWETGDWLIESNRKGTREKMQQLYKELRDTTLKNEMVEAKILELDHQLRDSGAFARDKQRWTESVHAENCNTLIQYAEGRLEFLDRALYNFELFEE